MLDLFNRKKKKPLPQLVDIDNNPLLPGDRVMTQRYDLGECELLLEEDICYYRSLKTGERVIWVKMIDASTERQKVKKVID